MARAMPGILPRLTLEEALEVTRIYSVADMLPPDTPLIQTRLPRTAPHDQSRGAGGWRTVAPAPARSAWHTAGAFPR